MFGKNIYKQIVFPLMIMFVVPHLYTESHLEKAILEGWNIEIPQGDRGKSPVFSSFSFDIMNDINKYFNPGNIVNNSPKQINIELTRYQPDGKQIRRITNEQHQFFNNTIKYSFESDSSVYDVTEIYDESGRIKEMIRENQNTREVFQHREFFYDEKNKMMFWYEKGDLRYILTEFREQEKINYIQYTKNGKMSSFIVFFNNDNSISKVEKTFYLPRNTDISITTCEYTNGKITRLRRYNQTTDKTIMDIQYFYKDQQFIGLYDSEQKVYEQYDDIDIHGNWKIKKYTKNGILQGVTRRELHYNDSAGVTQKENRQTQ
jgi:hypothetical protein